MKGQERNFVTSFSYPKGKEEILTEFKVISIREGKSQSEVLVHLIEEYVKAHSSGNPSFKLDQWQEDPDFKAVPTILAPSEQWFSYLKDCDKDDLTKIAISCKRRLNQIEHFRYNK